MADKAYEYMDWPRIEAIVYGEEASPRDVMQPRVTEDGVLIQGFFPGADAAEVVVGEKSYPMILEDEAGYYAVMLPLKRIPEYRFRVIPDRQLCAEHRCRNAGQCAPFAPPCIHRALVRE